MEPVMYKNQLQEYAQKSAIPLPVYQTINEGISHEQIYRSKVFVDGSYYNSVNTFSNRKEAEQDVARMALEGILQKPKDEAFPFLFEDTSLCKCIMNEYAVKMNFSQPTYVTKQEQGHVPVFVSDILLNDVNYTGQRAKNKKEAERLAARAAILSIMDSESKMVMSVIIKSKEKLYALLLNDGVNQSGVGDNVANNGGSNALAPPLHEFSNTKEVDSPKAIATINSVNVGSSKRKEVDSPEALATINSCNVGSSSLAQPFHEFKKPKGDPSSEVTPHPIIFVSPCEPCPSSGQEKKESQRVVEGDTRMSGSVISVVQDPPCSVFE